MAYARSSNDSRSSVLTLFDWEIGALFEEMWNLYQNKMAGIPPNVYGRSDYSLSKTPCLHATLALKRNGVQNR